MRCSSSKFECQGRSFSRPFKLHAWTRNWLVDPQLPFHDVNIGLYASKNGWLDHSCFLTLQMLDKDILFDHKFDWPLLQECKYLTNVQWCPYYWHYFHFHRFKVWGDQAYFYGTAQREDCFWSFRGVSNTRARDWDSAVPELSHRISNLDRFHLRILLEWFLADFGSKSCWTIATNWCSINEWHSGAELIYCN